AAGRCRDPCRRSAGAGEAGRSARGDVSGRGVRARGGSAEPGCSEKDEEREKEMKVSVPRGACDTHMHIYDSAAPAAPGTFMRGHFPASAYRAMQKRLGMERVIGWQTPYYAAVTRDTLTSI